MVTKAIESAQRDTVMRDRDANFWRFKAHALLLPTALSKVDAAEESKRVEAVRECFEFADDDTELLDQCFRDAGCAQSSGLGGHPQNQVGPEQSVPSLKHPLAADSLLENPGGRLSALRHAWREHWEQLPKTLETGAEYQRLWRTFVDPEDDDLWHLIAEQAMPDYSVWAHRSLAAAFAGARYQGGYPALLLLQVGPVQEFIEASRRTHDLWGGSYIISALAFEALRSIAEHCGPDAILTPWPAGLELAERNLFDRPWRDPSARTQPSLPAKVMALVANEEADELVERAHEAMRRKWQAMAQAVWDELDLVGHGGDKRSFDSNVDSFLELGAAVLAWPQTAEEARRLLIEVRWPSGKSDNKTPTINSDEEIASAYGPLSGVLWTGLSTHNKTRLPAPFESAERPKCTVCGRRDQVGHVDLGKNGVRDQTVKWCDLTKRAHSSTREALQLSLGEGLCAVCLTRRFAPEYFFGTTESGLDLEWSNAADRPFLRFPSVPSVAAAPWRYWIQQATSEREGEKKRQLEECVRRWEGAVNQLHDLLDFTPPGNGLPRLGPLQRSEPPTFLDFDGSWCFGEAYEPRRMLRDHGWIRRKDEPDDPLVELADQAQSAFNALCKELDCRASPYVAVLYLDGDEMSRWLNGDHPKTPTLGQIMGDDCPDGLEAQKRPVYPALQAEISRRLCALATGAVAEIVHKHLGRLVYCGGDDVLALLPLATALSCASQLDALFHEREFLGSQVTTSAGLAVFHCRTPLRAALQAARNAERKAKEERNQLAVHLEPRSGAPLEVVWPWEFEHDGEKVGTCEVLAKLRWKPSETAPVREDASSFPLRVARVLREELPALLGQTEIFLHRLRVGLYGEDSKRIEHTPEWSFINQLLNPPQKPDARGSESPAKALERRQNLVIDTLLVLLFLQREEHGIPTADLLARISCEEGANS